MEDEEVNAKGIGRQHAGDDNAEQKCLKAVAEVWNAEAAYC